MKVLALASYPIEAAATRYRLEQFVGPLAARGITLQIKPFLDSKLFASLYDRRKLAKIAPGLALSAARRLGDVAAARRADLILVQREAMLFGPPLVEWLAMTFGRCPLVLDLDDATYISYKSPTYGRLASALKWPGKTDYLIRRATVVTCGNRAIAEYVCGRGGRACIIPTVVDTERFRPAAPQVKHDPPVLGWVGTHSSFPYLESIFPALAELARERAFKLKIVGAGKERIRIAGTRVENLKWSLNREVEDFQSFDIGLYPIDVDLYGDWSAGKSGFKAIQYMAVGIPYVTTPVAACREIGEPGITHLWASTQEEWRESLSRLLSDEPLRRRMGAAGRRHALEHYTVEAHADKLALTLREATSGTQPAGHIA